MTINNQLLAKLEGLTAGQIALLKPPVDYSTSPADRERLLEYLMKEKYEMWKEFCYWSFMKNLTPSLTNQWETSFFYSWLFLPLDGVPRWVSLLSDWLGMEEVREKFGTTEVCSEFNRWHNPCPQFCDKCDDGTGKVHAEWAKE